jgi:tape measure domain-containing protein
MQVKKNIQVSAQLKNQFNDQAVAANKVTQSVKRQHSAMSGLHGMMIRLVGVMGARAMYRFGKDSVMVAADLEAMHTAMNFATGSTVQGINTMVIAKRVSQEYGLALLPAIEGLTKLSAASKNTSMEGKPAVDLFKGISKAVAVLGLNSERSHGTFMAFEQIMSKGKVSAEELRRQLGDRIPGAFQIAARAMGVSTSALDKMIRSGSLMSDVFLPKMAAQMEKEFAGGIEKASETTRASLNRLDNTILEIKESIGKELYPTVDIATVALEDLGDVADWFIELSQDSPKAFNSMAAGITALGGAATAAMMGLSGLKGGLAGVLAYTYAWSTSKDQTTQNMRDAEHGLKAHKELMEAQEELKFDFEGMGKEGGVTPEAFGEAARTQSAGMVENIKFLEESTKLWDRDDLKLRLKNIAEGNIGAWLSEDGEDVGGVLGTSDESKEVDAIESKLEMLNDLDVARKDAKRIAMEMDWMGGQAGVDVNAPDADALDSDATGVATVNGSGNHIMNIQIGNIVETLINEFREGDADQNEIESEKQIDTFKKGLFGVINDMKQLNQA